MNRIKLGAATTNLTPMDWRGNLSTIRDAIGKAKKQDVNILCLPEMTTTGYGCEDMFHSPHVQRNALDMLKKVSESKEMDQYMTVLVGLPFKYQNSLYNCVAVVVDHKIRGIVPKQNMAQDGVHYEPRWFQAWERGKVSSVTIDGTEVPFGDLIFNTDNGIRFGFEICEDAWVANRPAGDLARRGADIIFNPSASHFAFGKHQTRREIVRSGSRSTSCAYVYCNIVGNESGKIIYDGSRIIAAGGEILKESSRFSMKKTELTTAVVDIDALRSERTDREGFAPTTETTVVDTLRKSLTTKAPTKMETELETLTKEEEFERAVTLGLFDYMSKSGVNGYCVSLSGGADSSATAILVSMMAERLNELTPSELLDRNNFLKGKGHFGLEHKTTEDILTCFYQPTDNSSETTRDAAESIASDIGAKYLEIDVDAIVEAYKGVVGDSLNVDWDWDKHDIPLQNIQARSRGPSAWMVANVENKVLLATSNRSEAAVGYFTQGGDDSGGLAPILGVDKVFLRSWLRSKEKKIPSLELVNTQQPSAELKPGNQTDENDLMPYEVLDRIEHLFIQNKKGPKEVFYIINEEFNADENRTFEWVKKFYRLWCQNQWKRERGAASFHLDDKNLDPKSWCRFPILSSGFKRELEELKQEIDNE